MAIRNLLFDLGGVLLNYDLPRDAAALEAAGLPDYFSWNKYPELKDTANLFLNGLCSEEEFYPAIRPFCKGGVTDAEILYAMQAVLDNLPKERLECLKRLRKRYRIFLLSNLNTLTWEHTLKEFEKAGIGVDECFDKVFLSFEMGLAKPDPAIFKAVAQEAGIVPEETIFFDDNTENVESAAECGYHSIKVDMCRPEKILRELEDSAATGFFNPEVVIVGGGDYPSHPLPLHLLEDSPKVVCCDGAALRYIRESGKRPMQIVGDCDSLPEAFVRENADIITVISEQDDNDQTKAIHWCKEHGFRRIAIVAATGRREDHALANISLAVEYMREGMDVRIVTDNGVFIPCHNTFAHHAIMPDGYTSANTDNPQRIKGQQISIFNFGATGFRSRGLKYPIHDFGSWWEGTLNECSSPDVSITADGDFLIYLCY